VLLVGARQLVDALVGRLISSAGCCSAVALGSGRPAPSVSTAMLDAISPACAPPMPSATANSGARA
jgi:hypothetical protein